MTKIYQKTLMYGKLRIKRRLGGFTLIELLVVVLIIGILTAVALPSYEKAVEKSRAAEALTLFKSVVQANQVYYLANGTYASSFEDLDIDIPWQAESAAVRSNDFWKMTVNPSRVQSNSFGASVDLIRQDDKYLTVGFSYFFEPDRYKSVTGLYCRVSYYDRRGSRNYCEKIMGLTNPEIVSAWGRTHIYAM